MFLPQQAHFALSVLMNLFVFILFLFDYICNIQKWLTISKPKNKLILGLLNINLSYILVMYQNSYKKSAPIFRMRLISPPLLALHFKSLSVLESSVLDTFADFICIKSVPTKLLQELIQILHCRM